MEDDNTINIVYDYSDVPTVRKFTLEDCRVRCIIGPVGSGKTTGCIMEIIRRAHMQEPGPDGIRRSRWAVVRNSYRQLLDTTIKSFHDWYPPKLFGEWRVTDHTYLFTKIPGVHCEIMFRALDRPDQVSNLLSMELTGAWFNEVREIPKAIVDVMDTRIGRYPSQRDGGPTWCGMIMDTNPPDEGSWLYNIFEKDRVPGWKVFKQPSGLSAHAENIKNLPKNYYQNLQRGKSEMFVRIYVHGQYGFELIGKPVYQSFVDVVHMAPAPLEPIKGIGLLMSYDFGLTPACVIGQITPLGQVRILDELVSDGMGIRQFCLNQVLPLLRKKYFGFAVIGGYGDPSGISRSPTDESTCFEVLHSPEIGLRNIVEAPTNALVPRVGAVEYFLNKMYKGEPGLLISPTCTNLRRAMNGGYYYEKDSKSQNDETKLVPCKNFSSHIAETLQYLCLYITEKEETDKRRKAFMAQMQMRTPYRPGSYQVGY